eukprot:10240353-Alexandrium_andersonii.AAC.1
MLRAPQADLLVVPWRIAVPRLGAAWRSDYGPVATLLAVLEELRAGGGLHWVFQTCTPAGYVEPDVA